MGEVAEIIGGNAWKSSDYTPTGSHLVVTIANVTGEQMINDSVGNRIDIEDDNSYVLSNGDILISLTGNVGRVSRMTAKKAVLNQRVGKIVPCTSCNLRYIFQVLRSEKFQQVMELAGQGAAQKNISNSDVINYIFSLPSLNEQEKIGEYFSNLDTLITLHQRGCNIMFLYASYQLFTIIDVVIHVFLFLIEEYKMIFTNELEFERALVELLGDCGWEKEVIKNPTEQDLIDNWASIIFKNNRSIDRLNDYPLTQSEMNQILEQIKELRTPLRLNGFINGRTVSIIRDNPDDQLHLGKTVSLKIFDPREIAAGKSRYQIVEQPIFKTKSDMLNNRRGDVLLLINGMPVIHIELKSSNEFVSQACNQIEKYAHEGVFTGLFSLIQVFVAMNPDEAVYFANPGPDGTFNPNYFFHWADFNNEPINNWKDVAHNLLYIPMAHELIGYYTVADDSDGVLKVMRSYQIFASNAISDRVATTRWTENNQRGGFVWHTTGSGKTMTSFKSAQLIASSKNADKVVFLTDRIELGTQSLKEYRGFASENEDVQQTEDTRVLITKLTSKNVSDTLIVTSIQKMSNIKGAPEGLNSLDIETINGKRLVFIVDECHRSTFGEMLLTIKETFPNAIFFGFTGTPIQNENSRYNSTTIDVFGNELHRYSIADGIRDGNVLGFDPYRVATFRDDDLRTSVALHQAHAASIKEALSSELKAKVYQRFMNKGLVKMAGYEDSTGKYIKGIEDYIPSVQYRCEEHQNKVVEDIIYKWPSLSMNGKFHALFATSSIPEAIEYYRLLKEKAPELKVTCLFDSHIDNRGGATIKEDGLAEILSDYNTMFNQSFTIPRFASFKKDVAMRLAHKGVYKRIDNDASQQLNILIVVDQMLTGFDSKWINTLYLDKLLEYANVIQAFSRTNRLFDENEKPFGIIRYYRKPHTMEKNIEDAVKLYSGDRPLGLFVDKLEKNVNKMNRCFNEIVEVFEQAGVSDFSDLPEDSREKAKFASLFNDFNTYLNAAKIQGFKWEDLDMHVAEDEDAKIILVDFSQEEYVSLLQRYKDLAKEPGNSSQDSVPFEIEGYLVEVDTGLIDSNYMNSKFEKYLKELYRTDPSSSELEQARDDLIKMFAMLTADEQKYANVFIHDIQRGNIRPEPGKSFMQYITEYQYNAKEDEIHDCAEAFGLDEELLRTLMGKRLTEANYNEYGRFDELIATVDKKKAKEFLQEKYEVRLNPAKVQIRTYRYLLDFVLSGGTDF